MNRLGNVGILLMGIALCVWVFSHQTEYQIVQLGEMARNQFLLDKHDGRIWQKVCMSAGKVSGPDCDGELIWEEMYVGDLTSENSTPAKIHKLMIEEMQSKKKTNESPKPNSSDH